MARWTGCTAWTSADHRFHLARVRSAWRNDSMNIPLIRSWITFSPARFHARWITSTVVSCTYLDERRGHFWHSRLRRMQHERDRQLLKQRTGETSKRPPRGDNRHKPRLRGHPKDEEVVRISKTLSWLLRHGANQEGLAMRLDGYVRVEDLVSRLYFRKKKRMKD